MDTFPRTVVVIDDERTFDTDEPIVYLRTADEALAYLAAWWTMNLRAPMDCELWIDALYLDHDLGPGQDAGVVADFLSCLREIGPELPILEVFVHTQNPVGAKNLLATCANIGQSVTRIPLPNLI